MRRTLTWQMNNFSESLSTAWHIWLRDQPTRCGDRKSNVQFRMQAWNILKNKICFPLKINGADLFDVCGWKIFWIFSHKWLQTFFWEVCRNGWEITCLGNETSSQFVLRVSRYTARRSGLEYEKDENNKKVWPRIWERWK